MNTSILCSAVALSLAASVAAPAADSTTVATPAFIQRLAKEAAGTHPKAQASRERAEAARASIGAVRLWQDPELGLGFMAARQSMRQDDGDIVVGVDQMLPRVGVFKAEKRRAQAEQKAQIATVQFTENELGLAAAQAALELALSDEVVKLQTENLQWLEAIVKTAGERSKNPDGSATESLRLEGELAIQQQTLASARRQKLQYASTLNILLGRNIKTEWPELSLPSNMPPLPSVSALTARLEAGNPQLAAMRHMVEGAQAGTESAKQMRKPAFSVGVETNSYSGGDLRSTLFMVKMSIPWFNRSTYNAEVLKAQQLSKAAQSDLEAQQRELYTQLNELVTDAQNNEHVADAYDREVLPKAQQAVDSIQNAWVSSKSTLLDVLDARRSLLTARQEQKRALAARHVAYHSLSAITGTFSKP